MKVLIVEDDAALRRIYIQTLRRMFDEVDARIAESADEAIDQLRDAAIDRPFDLVISDYNLLGTRTGAEVLAWVRDHASYLVPRFLFISASDALVKVHTKHPNILAKPADMAQLRAVIEATIQRS